jgi:zona occludens toxin
LYDEITKPTTAPFPAACASMGKRCRCYSQQGTALDVPHQLCENIVDRGFFKEWEERQQVASAEKGGPSKGPLKSDVKTEPLPMQPAPAQSASSSISQDLVKANRSSQ